MGPGASPGARHDALLAEIMAQEGNNVADFLNSIFGFLARHSPEEVYGDSSGGGGHISGEHLVSQSFCRWRQRYRDERTAKEEELRLARMRACDGVPAAVVEEEVVSTNTVETDGVEEANEKMQAIEVEEGSRWKGNTNKPSSSTAAQRKGEGGRCGGLDTTNGAALEGLAWTQGIDDLEVRVVVPPGVSRGKQVKVTVRQTSLAVEVQGGAAGGTGAGPAWHTLLDGTLPHPVRAEECLWSLAPAEYVTINLEKCEERWWDRLLTRHAPIDLAEINAERDYGSLPEEERSKIQELVWNKWQADQGRPTSDQLRMESVLRQAWTAEGSPFLGQPFDPSAVNVVGGQGFGAG